MAESTKVGEDSSSFFCVVGVVGRVVCAEGRVVWTVEVLKASVWELGAVDSPEVVESETGSLVGSSVGATVGVSVAGASVAGDSDAGACDAGDFDAGDFVASEPPSSPPQATNNETLRQIAIISTKTFLIFIDSHILFQFF